MKGDVSFCKPKAARMIRTCARDVVLGRRVPTIRGPARAHRRDGIQRGFTPPQCGFFDRHHMALIWAGDDVDALRLVDDLVARKVCKAAGQAHTVALRGEPDICH